MGKKYGWNKGKKYGIGWRTDHNYTNEEARWLKFVDEWRMKENHNRWPSEIQRFRLFKKFFGLAVILLCCSVCFGSCRIDWGCFPKGGDLRSYSVFADKWLAIDAECVMIERQKEYQQAFKYYHSGVFAKWRILIRSGVSVFMKKLAEVKAAVEPHNFMILTRR